MSEEISIESSSDSSLVPVSSISVKEVFTSPNGVDSILKAIQAQVDSFIPDMTTKAGQKAIASMAYKVAKTKTTLDDLGKDLTAEMKKQTSLVDSNRKLIRDFCDELKEKVRKPLTDFENKEKERIQTMTNRLNNLRSFANITVNGIKLTLEQMQERMIELKEIGNSLNEASWNEFLDSAKMAYSSSVESLSREISERETYLKEQAELEKLRKEKEEREKKEREDQIARESAERARKEAEEKDEKERLAKEREHQEEIKRKQDEVNRIEREKQEALERKKQAELKAEQDRIAKENEIKRLEEENKQRIAKAIEEEKKKIEMAIQREKEHQEKREKDLKHRAIINNSALNSIIEHCGLNEDQAKEVVKAIAKGLIENVSIKY